MILCLGSLADESSGRGPRIEIARCAVGRPIDLGHLALAGEIRLSASEPLEATLGSGVRRALSS